MKLRSDYERPVPVDDGLVKSEVGTWARRKHHFIGGYINAFTTAMKGKRWGALHYIDLFAGPGMAAVRGGGLEWGSPVLAATARYKFHQIHACELEADNVAALKSRLAAFPQPQPPSVIQGDANEKVREIIACIPGDSLSLALVDPWNLDGLRFETLGELAKRRCDLIVYFPDHLDALRNLEVYKQDPESSLSRYMGSPEWVSAIEGVARENQGERLLEFFKGRLGSLGYEHFAEKRIERTDTRRLYMLVFGSKHPKGREIWLNVAAKDYEGQRDLPF